MTTRAATTAGIGTVSNTKPLPTTENDWGKSLTGIPRVMVSATPRAIESVPRVTMKGFIPILVTASPCKSPITAPAPNVKAVASTGWTPPRNIRASTTPVKATTEPGDRSIPAVMMTNVSPIAMIPNTATERATVCRLYRLANAGLIR